MRTFTMAFGSQPMALPMERLSLVNTQIISPATPAPMTAPANRGRLMPVTAATWIATGKAMAYIAQEEPRRMVNRVDTRNSAAGRSARMGISCSTSASKYTPMAC